MPLPRYILVEDYIDPKARNLVRVARYDTLKELEDDIHWTSTWLSQIGIYTFDRKQFRIQIHRDRNGLIDQKIKIFERKFTKQKKCATYKSSKLTRRKK